MLRLNTLVICKQVLVEPQACKQLNNALPKSVKLILKKARENVELDSEYNGNKLEIRLRCTLDQEKFGNPEISLKIKIPGKSSIEGIRSEDEQIALGTKKCFLMDEESALLLTVPASTKKIDIQMKGNGAL